MKGLLLLTALVGAQLISAQCSPPPPPSLFPVYSVDMDNDGFAPFDIDNLIAEYHRPIMEQAYTASSSGYNVTFYNNNNEPTTGVYINIVPAEQGIVNYVHSGSGPTFNAWPPCYWPGWEFTGFQLNAVPQDGDLDGDGILNKDEDTNLNINLMDDDSDGDGLVDVLDATNSPMAVPDFDKQFVLYPNPVGDILHLSADLNIISITFYDFIGKKVLTVNSPKSQINVESLSAGIYLLKLDLDGISRYQKIIVQ